MQNTYQTGYKDFILGIIKQTELTKPIFTKDIAKKLGNAYCLPENKALAATAVSFKRIMDKNEDPSLRFYKNGIYYRTQPTAFGEPGIDKTVLIGQKYLVNGKGYETDFSLLNTLGLTTQIPAQLQIASNVVKRTIYDSELQITVKPAKITITKQNRRYLQILDAMETMKKAPIDAPEPFKILAKYIKKYNLGFAELLDYAIRYYNLEVVRTIALTAEEYMLLRK